MKIIFMDKLSMIILNTKNSHLLITITMLMRFLMLDGLES